MWLGVVVVVCFFRRSFAHSFIRSFIHSPGARRTSAAMIVPAAVLRQIHFAGDHDEDEEETTRLELYTVRARRIEPVCVCWPAR